MPLYRVARNLMGSLFEILAFGEEPEKTNQALQSASDLARQLELQLSPYVSESEISQLNAHAFETDIPVSQNLFCFLIKLREWTVLTEGAFDPTIGKLIREWGFFRQNSPHAAQTHFPPLEKLRSLVRQTGWEAVQLHNKNRTVRFLTPEVEFNLGAVGKGYVVDCVAERLKQEGVFSALLHSGYSSIVALEPPPDAEGWAVGLPTWEGEFEASVSLKNQALSSSDSGEQTTLIDGVEYSHILDPRTGLPIPGKQSISIISPSALEGDALSTALLVLGEKGKAILSSSCRNFEVVSRNGRRGF